MTIQPCVCVAKTQAASRCETMNVIEPDQEQRLAAHAVDQRHAHEGHQEIGHSHDDRLHEGIRAVGPCHAENIGGVVDDGVDAVELVESRDHAGEQQRLEVFALEEPVLGLRAFARQRLLNFPRFPGGVFVAEAVQHGLRLVQPAAPHEPARTLGDQQSRDQKRERGKRHHPEHPAPGGVRVLRPGNGRRDSWKDRRGECRRRCSTG